MSSARTQSSPPSTADLVEGVLFYPIALVVSATIVPGFTLCIPGLLFDAGQGGRPVRLSAKAADLLV